MKKKIQHGIFILRYRYLKPFSTVRNMYFKALGMQIGKRTSLSKVFVTWPHQVSLGQRCTIEHNVFFKFDGIWQNGPSIKIGDNVFIGFSSEFNITQGIEIGNDCLIASGCKFIDHNHGLALGTLIRTQVCTEKKIVIHENVWFGCNCIVLQGVEIHQGAVIAAGAVVTKSVPANEIWGGIPAKKLGERK